MENYHRRQVQKILLDRHSKMKNILEEVEKEYLTEEISHKNDFSKLGLVILIGIACFFFISIMATLTK